MTKKQVTMIDPPAGWKYGFPKAIPAGVDDVHGWLVSEGYPQKMIDELGDYFFTRSWIEEVEE